MKKTLFFLIFLTANFVLAQTHRFFYSVNFLNNTVTNKYVSDIVILDVNTENIKSYGNEYLITDSINVNNDFKNEKMAHPIFKNIIKKYIGSDNFENYEFIQGHYYVYNTNDKMKWKILQEKDKFGGYNIQKAETDFGGRHWIAWFTPDIPFPFGPYKFSGLPGLILKISDTKNEYFFSLIKNKNYDKNQGTDRFVENFKFYETYKPLQITESQLQKLKIDNFLDPYREVRSSQEDVTFVDENGKQIKPDIKKMTKDFQSKILSENNPLEINKAIKYPLN